MNHWSYPPYFKAPTVWEESYGLLTDQAILYRWNLIMFLPFEFCGREKDLLGAQRLWKTCQASL